MLVCVCAVLCCASPLAQVSRIAQLAHLDFEPGTERFEEVRRDMTAMLRYIDNVNVSDLDTLVVRMPVFIVAVVKS